MKSRFWIVGIALLGFALNPAAAQETGAAASEEAANDGGFVDSSELPAEIMPLASESLLLDVTDNFQRAIVVGERGHVLLSEDRETWRQAVLVPTRSTLTAVFANGNNVWAVGHDAVIIHSQDGGENWVLQHAAPDWQQPLLDVYFMDDANGIAIGAYGLYMRTSDGGESWDQVEFSELIAEDTEANDESEEMDEEDYEFGQDFSDFEDNIVDYHLNAVARLSDGTLYIAAEAGQGYRSTNNGRTWQEVALPYEGSMFGVLATPDGSLVTFGLRGNAFESDDGGLNWTLIDTGTLNSLLGGAVSPDGSIVLVGANGEVLHRPAGGSSFTSKTAEEGEDLSSVVPMTNNVLIVVGEDGVTKQSLLRGGQS